MRIILGKLAENPGTKFYEVKQKDIEEIWKDKNTFLLYGLKNTKFECIDLDSIPGSRLIDSTLYICDTDDIDILVNDDSVNPEKALDKYTVTELKDYIEPGTDNKQRCGQLVTVYELVLTKNEIDEIAEQAMKDGISFRTLYKDYHKLENLGVV